MMKARRHDIYIDHLVLPAGTVGRERVREAVERELTRLARAGELSAGSDGGDVRLGAIQAAAARGSDARALGRAVGAAAGSKRRQDKQ